MAHVLEQLLTHWMSAWWMSIMFAWKRETDDYFHPWRRPTALSRVECDSRAMAFLYHFTELKMRGML